MSLSIRSAILATLLALSAPFAFAGGDIAPDFTLRDIDGQSVSLSSLRGEVVLINFWATWCGPCQVEMPHLERMYKDLHDQGFTVLSISADDARTASQVKPLVKRNGYTYPVLLDKETAVVSQYNPGKTLPYSVLVDRDGRVAQVHQGFSPGDEVKMRSEIEALLGAPAAGPSVGPVAPAAPPPAGGQ